MDNEIKCMSYEDFKKYTATKSQWRRAGGVGLDYLTSDISFQLFDITVSSSLSLPSIINEVDENGRSPLTEGFRLFGVTENGMSVCVNVNGYSSYFYASFPSTFSWENLKNFKDLVNEKYAKESKYKFEVFTAMEKTELGTLPVESSYPLIKCCVREQWRMEEAVKILKREMGLLMNGFDLCTYEDEVDLLKKFCMDLKIRGCSWLSIKADKYSIVSPELKRSSCIIELEVCYQNLVCMDLESNNLFEFAIPRIFGFDIECFVRRNVFSDWSIDPVITISCVIRDGYRQTDSQFKVIFVLGSCSEINGVEVFCFHSEKEMLQSWEYFLKLSDPDILVGYNILNFDFNYLMSRGSELKIDDFGNFGRLVKLPEADKDYIRYNLSGRVVFDFLPIIRLEYPKFSCYKLASVCNKLLNDDKENIDVNCLGQLHEGTASDRRHIALYCVKDAILSLKLMDHLNIFEKYTQVAAVSGLLLKSVAMKNKKSFDLATTPLLQSAHLCGCTIKKTLNEERNTLSRVTLPETSILFGCIVLEFNICFQTFLSKEKARNLPANTMNKTPCGSYFLKKHNRKGIVPLTFAKLFGQMKTIRIQIKNQKDLRKLRLLYCRLTALKNTLHVLSVMLQSTHSSYYFYPIHSSLVSYSQTLSQEEKLRLRKKYYD